MKAHTWTVTIDAAFPTAVTEIDDESIHRFLDSIAQYRGALNVGRFGYRGLAVTVSLDATELEQPTFRSAAARGEAIVREHLPAFGPRAEWVITSIEVSVNDEHRTLHLLPTTVAE
jgi:hypothetical protein